VTGPKVIRQEVQREVDVQRAEGRTDAEIVADNDLTDIRTLAHLLDYDSVLGRLPYQLSVDGDTSTSDQCLILASGAVGNAEIADADSPEARTFTDAVFIPSGVAPSPREICSMRQRVRCVRSAYTKLRLRSTR